MATKTISIRISEDQARFLTENYSSVSNGVNEALTSLEYIRLYSTKELQGRFTPAEWSFIIDSLNGTLIEGLFRCNAGALAAHCEDSAKFEGTDVKWGVNVEELSTKIMRLTGAQIEALYGRVEHFWKGGLDLDAYSVF